MWIMQSNEWRRFCSFSTVFDGFQSRRKKLELWGLVFSGLWPRYGFSIPMVSYHRFGLFLETHTAPSSLLFKVLRGHLATFWGQEVKDQPRIKLKRASTKF